MSRIRILNSLLLLLLVSVAAGAQGLGDTDAEKPRHVVPAKRVPVPPSASTKAVPANEDMAGDEESEPAATASEPSLTRREAEPAKAAEPAQATEPRELSPQARTRRDALRRCLAYYFFRPETTAERAPWGAMHAIVGFGVDTALDIGNEKANAIGWLCWNQPCNGQQLFRAERGQVVAPIGVGVQGHEGQFLQVMALSRVPQDYVMKINGQEFTIADVVKREQRTCRARTELSFKLVGLSHYLDSKTTWRNQAGELWNLERIIQEELAQPVNNSVACGGTHRLMGLGYAVRKHQRRGEAVTGQWERAKRTVDQYAAYAFRVQNPDGSFSTNWFEGPGQARDIERQLNTTGHILEWLLLSLPDEQLDDPRLAQAAQFLASLMWRNRSYAWYIGAKGHALHALALYDERVFGAQPGKRLAELAPFKDEVAADGPPVPRQAEEPAGPPTAGRLRTFRAR